MTSEYLIAPKHKQDIAVDFDGVLNQYNGYDGDNLGQPRPGAREFLEHLNLDYNVIIFSVRRYTLIIEWLRRYDLLDLVTNVTRYKPLAAAYIDDRGIRFDGDYEKCLRELKTFRPYWQK